MQSWGMPMKEQVKDQPIAKLWRFAAAVTLLGLGTYVAAALDARLLRAYGGLTASPATPPIVSTPAAGEMAPGARIGRLEIPRAGVSALVFEGIERDHLARGVGHLPASVLPGQGGDVVIAGHRGGFFRGLRHVRPGDLVALSTTAGERVYGVESVAIADPPAALPAHRGTETLTLVTGFPFHESSPATHLLVIVARPVDDSPRR